jgi:hypothetical protein
MPFSGRNLVAAAEVGDAISVHTMLIGGVSMSQ